MIKDMLLGALIGGLLACALVYGLVQDSSSYDCAQHPGCAKHAKEVRYANR